MEEYDTLKFYNDNAQKYYNQTVNGNMQEVYNGFLYLLPQKGHILDFGCGSGRDSKYFLDHGYDVTAVDGSEKLCKLAEAYIKHKVLCMKFNELSDVSLYDGIWACSSILHVERKNLPDILRKMIIALKNNGIMYTSFKKGDCELVESGKYYNYINREIMERMLYDIDLDSEIVGYTENVTCSGVNRPTATWSNYLIKKRTR